MTRTGYLRIVLFSIAALLFGLAAPANAATVTPRSAPPATCAAGWSYQVSHSWWTELGEAFPGRHIHLGGCVPSHVRLTGSSVPLKLKLELHNRPGFVKWVRACWEGDCVVYNRTGWSCSVADCDFTVNLSVPFGGRTGWYELRLSANIEPNAFGDRQFESTRYPVGLNTSAAQPTSGEGGRTGWAGWYHGAYQNVYVDEASAKKLESAAGITLPFTFKLKGDKPKTTVAINANSHAGIAGLVLGTTTSTSFQPYTIPSGLAPGWYQLFGRTEQSFSDGVSAGQGELWFRVR